MATDLTSPASITEPTATMATTELTQPVAPTAPTPPLQQMAPAEEQALPPPRLSCTPVPGSSTDPLLPGHGTVQCPLSDAVRALTTPTPAPKALRAPRAPASGDYLDFVFDAADVRDATALAMLRDTWLEATAACRDLRANAALWSAEQTAKATTALHAVDAAREAHGPAIAAALIGACQADPGAETTAVGAFLRANCCRQTDVLRATAVYALVRATPHAMLLAAKQRLHAAVRARLVPLASNLGLRVPFQITTGLWAFGMIQAGVTADDAGLGASLGDVTVSCTLCCVLIEGEGRYARTPRYRSLDRASTTFCCECYGSLRELRKRAADVVGAAVPGVHDAVAMEDTVDCWKQVRPGRGYGWGGGGSWVWVGRRRVVGMGGEEEGRGCGGGGAGS